MTRVPAPGRARNEAAYAEAAEWHDALATGRRRWFERFGEDELPAGGSLTTAAIDKARQIADELRDRLLSAPEACAAAIARAERAEQTAGVQRDALAAVLEAIGIPYPATVGDGEVHGKVLAARVMHVRTFLGTVLRDQPADMAWSVAYLRERLAEHPADGYRTWDEAVAELRAREAGGQP